MRWSGRKGTICTAIATAGWTAGCGRVAGPDSREMALADLNVLWGTNPVSTQVNVMAHVTRARKERGAKLVVIDPYRTGTAAAADMHLALRPGTDAALACAVMHCAFRDGHADRAYMAATPTIPRRWRRTSRRAGRTGRPASPGCPRPRSRPSPRSTTPRRAPTSAPATGSPAGAMGRRDARRDLPADRDRQVAHEGGGALCGMKRHLSLGQDR